LAYESCDPGDKKLPESVKRQSHTPFRRDETRSRLPAKAGTEGWERALTEIFGPHRVETRANGSDPRVIEGGNGLLRYWTVKHRAIRLVAGGRGRGAEILKTGTFLLLLVKHGKADIELFGSAIRLEAGDALLVTAIEPLVFATSGTFSGSWVELPVWWLVELFGGGLSGARCKLDGKLASTVILRAVVSQLWATDTPAQAQDAVDLFGDVLRRCLIIAGRGTEDEEGQLGRITQFIARNHRREGLSPKDASRTLGCSISSIHKYCAAAGTSFGKMVAITRASHAAYRLAREDGRIAQIAYECGFASVSHFCRTFKSIYGVTPRSVRARYAAERA
jgi:AraC-like DNA-binding protein